MYKSPELFFGDGSKELDTGEACSGQQLRKLFFGRRAFQRHTIQQELRARGAHQQPALRAKGNRCMQLFPSRFELFVSTGVFVAVQPGKLQ